MALGCLVLTLGCPAAAGGCGVRTSRAPWRTLAVAPTVRAARIAAGDLGLFTQFPATPRGAVAARTLLGAQDNRLQMLTVTTVMMYLLLAVGFPLFISATGREHPWGDWLRSQPRAGYTSRQ